MKPQRHKEWMDYTTLDITYEEATEGWHFCPDWDGALIKTDDQWQIFNDPRAFVTEYQEEAIATIEKEGL